MQATWPYMLDWTMQSMPKLIGQSQPPQQSISGTMTRIPRLGGRWEVKASFLIHGEARELAYSAFLAQMQGDLGTTLVPVWSRYRPKDRDGLHLPFHDTAGIKDAQTFEHFGFENTDIPRITLATPAALRATEIDLTLNDSTGLRPGQYFSLGDRLHRVQQHWQPGNGHRVMIEPPLRTAAASGTRLEIARPVCRMFIANEQTQEYNINGAFTADLTFEEAL